MNFKKLNSKKSEKQVPQSPSSDTVFCNMPKFSHWNELFINTYQRFGIVPDRGRGSFIYSGKRKYLDMISGIGVNSLGHLDRDVVKNLKEQLKRYFHLSNLFWQKVQVKFAQEFLKTLGKNYSIFLSNSGAEAVECALKISKLIHQGKRKKFLCFIGSFHGRTHGALSATWKEEFRKPFEPLLEGFVFVQFGNIEKVRAELEKGEYIAVLAEPIQGEGGVIVPPANFIRELRKVCDETDTLLMLDEIQTGVGKTGRFWCFEWEEIKPDVLISSKAIGGGLPLGVTAFSERFKQLVKPGMHASTFGGNPLACAAGIAVIRKVRRKGFLKSVIEKGLYIKEKVQKDIGFEVEGKGLMLGIILGKVGTIDTQAVTSFFLKRGIIINCIKTYKDDVRIRLLPPLTISKSEIDVFLDALLDFKVKKV